MQHTDSSIAVSGGLAGIQQALVGLIEAGGVTPVERPSLGDALAALESTVAVGCYPEGKSLFGMFDASGNAWDWLRTVWGPGFEEPLYADPYDVHDGREALDAGPEMLRCMRDGAFLVEEERAASTFGDAVEPDSRDNAESFRVVITNSADAQKQSSEGPRR